MAVNGDTIREKRLSMFPQDQNASSPSRRRGASFLLGTGSMAAKAAVKIRGNKRGREGSMSDGTSEERSVFVSQPNLEPTYKTTPNTGEEFQTSVVESNIETLLKASLHDTVYNARQAPDLGVALSAAVHREMKKLCMPRYKLICHVMLAERRGQGVQFASRCMWDEHLDSYACVTYQNDSLIAVATVYGVYHE